MDVDAYRNWTPAAQERALARLQQAQNERWRPFYCKQADCDGKPHGEWEWSHARKDQRPPSDPDWLVWLLCSGRGCVAPWTRVYDPVADRHVRVDEMRTAMPVQTVSGIAWTDGGSFMKGTAHMWTVVCEDGSEITVTDQHRFLTPRGWRRLADVRVGQPLAAAPRAQRREGSSDPSRSRTGGPRSTGTTGGSRSGCRKCRGSGDRPLPAAGDGVPGAAPSPAGVRGRILWLLHLDGPACGAGCTPRGPHGTLRSRTGSGAASPSRAAWAARVAASVRGSFPLTPGSVLQSLRRIVSRQRGGAAGPDRGGPSSPRTAPAAAAGSSGFPAAGHRVPPAGGVRSGTTLLLEPQVPSVSRPAGTGALHVPNPQLDVTTWTRIVSITYSHHGVYYDLTVPGAEHYLAEGLFNHNSGKSRAGSEWVHRMVERTSRIAIVAPTGADVRDVLVEGESGILTIAPPGKRPQYEPSKRRLTWPNGAVATTFSAEEPDRMRGPEHGALWLDEAAFMPLIQEAWDNLMFGLRIGQHPRVCVTTTPKPRQWLKDLIADPRTRLSRASTYDNLHNLSPVFAEKIIARYEGTRLGRQELHAEILTDVEGALWTWEMIEENRIAEAPDDMDRVVVAVDPAGSSRKTADETGIVVVGAKAGTAYVLADRSGRYSPHGWATTIRNLYDDYAADAVVVETNYGGEMVENTLRTSGVTARLVKVNARRGKSLRAEPVVGLFEQGKVKMVGTHTALEDQLTSWIPFEGSSPDRLDAMVYGITHVSGRAAKAAVGSPLRLVRGA